MKDLDVAANAYKLMEQTLKDDWKQLEAQKIKIEIDNERLIFEQKMAETDKNKDLLHLIQAKNETVSDIKKKIKNTSKTEQIIIKVM